MMLYLFTIQISQQEYVQNPNHFFERPPLPPQYMSRHLTCERCVHKISMGKGTEHKDMHVRNVSFRRMCQKFDCKSWSFRSFPVFLEHPTKTILLIFMGLSQTKAVCCCYSSFLAIFIVGAHLHHSLFLSEKLAHMLMAYALEWN